MGHYFADLMCDACGEVRCRCEPIPAKKTDPWVVDDDFGVVRASDYQKANDKFGLGYLRRMSKTHFDEKSDARAEAKKQLDAAIKTTEEQLVNLKVRRAVMKAKK
jgi:hypothetical protein